MKTLALSKPLVYLGIVILLIIGIGIVNYLIIRYSGTPVPAPNIPRGPETYGQGRPLAYVVLGDSTTIAQGGDYDTGYARATARFIATKGYMVTFRNFGVSGARAIDVAEKQAAQAAALKPDVVLIAVGANDVTHLTSIDAIRGSLQRSIDTLRKAQPNVSIIMTGSPDMGSIPRFPQPSRFLAGFRTRQINDMVRPLAAKNNVIFAPIADKTGPVFDARPELYAADRFHPNREGYDLWTPVLNDALEAALRA